MLASQVDMKPASDVIAGAMARAASQGTIHPLDTLKVQLQSGKGRAVRPALSKIGQLVPPHGDCPLPLPPSWTNCMVLDNAPGPCHASLSVAQKHSEIRSLC
jgi:hypothetical protein